MDGIVSELQEEWKRLAGSWAAAQGLWLDDQRGRFEQAHWQPLATEVHRLTRDFQDFSQAADESRRALARLLEG